MIALLIKLKVISRRNKPNVKKTVDAETEDDDNLKKNEYDKNACFSWKKAGAQKAYLAAAAVTGDDTVVEKISKNGLTEK